MPIIFGILILVWLIFSAVQPAPARVKDDPAGLEFFEKGKSAFNAKRYKEAQAALIQAAKLGPRTGSSARVVLSAERFRH